MANIYTPPRLIKTSFPQYSGQVNNLSYLKTSNTIEQFSQKARYDIGDEYWITTDNVNGTITHNSNASQRVLTIGSGATSKIGSQTKQCFVYLSGNVHRYTSAIKPNLQVGAIDKTGTTYSINRNIGDIYSTGTSNSPRA